MVYQVIGDSLGSPVIIEELDRIDNNILIKSGLKAGDKIIANGADRLQGPTPVIPQPVSYDSLMNSIQPIFR